MKTFAQIFFTVLVLMLFGPETAQAKDKRASLPTSVLSARTVYVDNQTTSAELQNTAYTEISKWGRLQIVEDPQKADIILRLSSGSSVRFVPGGENPPAYDPKAARQNWTGADEAMPLGSTRISVVDPKSGNSLWSDVRKTNNPKVASHMLDGLRDAFDQKEK
jgi:hypothetical protein